MPQIDIKVNEPVELAVRKFKRACERAGIGADVRKKMFYEKPAWERKRKKIAAIKRNDKNRRAAMMGAVGSVTTAARTGAMTVTKAPVRSNPRRRAY